ncbi:unnamed protein product [marine sediment metagenome]|uniref:Uncharacterized protein n=1 Tax=marine sediment metagenome TaxID=412755 RepID=X0RR65_9ZZZZ
MGDLYPFNPGVGQTIQSEVKVENPDMSFIAHLEWSAAEAATADIDAVHAAVTDAGDGTATTVTTGFTDPPSPRNITATSDDVTGDGLDIKAVQVVVTGTNINDEVITETLPIFTVNAETTVEGDKAFKTVTQVVIPAMDSPYDVTVSIGFGDILGIPYERDEIPCVDTFLNSVLESTAATIVAHITNIENNTIDLHSSLNGSKVDTYILV